MVFAATDLALRAFQARPARAEALADLARIARDLGMNEVSAMFARRGLAIPPGDDMLFVEAESRESLATDLSICGYYSRDPETRELAHRTTDALAVDRTVSPETRELARRNLHFYLRPIADVFPSWRARRLMFAPPDGYRQMAPSVTRHGTRVLAAQRCINYWIDAEGYCTPTGRIGSGGVVHTRTLLVEVDPDTLVESVRGEITMPGLVPDPAAVVLGFEDMRLFSWEGELWGISTVLDQNPHGHAEQWLARVAPDLSLVDARAILPEPRQPREKNWMPVVDGPRLRFIYMSDPMRIIDATGRTVAEGESSLAADHLRGGSQAIPFLDGWLAVVHWVVWFDGWPKYRHRFAFYDRGLRLRALSPGWVFPSDAQPELLRGYQYVTGLCHHPDEKRLIVGFQVDEREAWVGVLDAEEVAASLGLAPKKIVCDLRDTVPPSRNDDDRWVVPPSRNDDDRWVLEQTNRALQDDAAVERATRALKRRGLPEHGSRRKNWDTYLAIWHCLDKCAPDGGVLDAGGDRNSSFLRAMARLGYGELYNINLDESNPGVEDGVRYGRGDVTATGMMARSFRFVLCQSVLEHDVDWRAFYREMARLIVPGGHLLVSIDYWETPVTAPAKVFTPAEVHEMVGFASAFGLVLTGSLDHHCRESFEWYGGHYTFLNLMFRAQ